MLSDIPVAVSFPHFYGGEPSLLDNVEGLAPDAEKHESEVAVQPVTNPIWSKKYMLYIRGGQTFLGHDLLKQYSTFEDRLA